jgi:enoyl-CoA hydratase/carnithine racemase
VEAIMALVTLEPHEDVAVLRLTNGVTNPINPALLDELDEALQAVRGQFSGLVLAGNTKFFSMGFDLPFLLKQDRAGMAGFFYRFNDLAGRLYALPLPTVCVIAGHAVAGGFILAQTCDYRFAADGKQKMGLNEVRLGVPVPYLSDLMLRQVAGDRAATAMIYEGAFITAAQALPSGIVDQVFPGEMVEAQALEKVKALANLPKAALAAIKSNRVGQVLSRYSQHHREKNEAFLDCWCSAPVQQLLQEAARKF